MSLKKKKSSKSKSSKKPKQGKSVDEPEPWKLDTSNWPEDRTYAPTIYDYTKEEREKHAQVKEELELPEWVDDLMIYRFLRARSFDVELAIEKLENHIAFKESFEEWDEERVKETNEYKMQISYLLKDKDLFGRPVLYVQPKNVNAALRNVSESEQYFIWMVNEAEKFRKDSNVDSICMIMNMSGWGLRNRDMFTLKMQIDHFNENYPECLGRCFVVSAPWFVSPVWKMAKMWLDARTVEKVVFCDQAELAKVMSREKLPVGVGGVLPDSEPLMEVFPKSNGWFGGWFGSKASDEPTEEEKLQLEKEVNEEAKGVVEKLDEFEKKNTSKKKKGSRRKKKNKK